MGVDYTPNYGIGYKLNIPDNLQEDETMEDYLNDIKGEGYQYFQTGSENYGGISNEWYIVVKNPFENGLDLAGKKTQLDSIIAENNISVTGSFGLKGGLYVW